MPPTQNVCVSLGFPDECIYLNSIKKGNFIIMTRNKQDLITAISEKTGVTKREAAKMVDAMLEYVIETLESGDSISIRGYGALECKIRKERTAYSPKTGEPIQVPRRRAVVFHAGTCLKNCVPGSL